MKKVLIILSILIFTSCSDNATVNIFDKKITQTKIKCLKLVVFPPNEMIESTLEKLYDFDENCSVRLDISSKSSIVCNSNQNSQKKALSNFPTSYLKMQIMNPNLAYSYYEDLNHDITQDDINRAFSKIDDDLLLR